jgi:hypothetical protein
MLVKVAQFLLHPEHFGKYKDNLEHFDIQTSSEKWKLENYFLFIDNYLMKSAS